MTGASIASTAHLDALDRAIINRLQLPLPLVDRPFAAIGAELGCGEDDIITRARRLIETGILTRFGPFIDAEAMGGAFCLCALSAPQDRFDTIAGIVNSFDEVAHNYERDHTLNMWFVLATETKEGIAAAVEKIETATGLPVYPFPKLKEYFVEMKLSVRNAGGAA